MTLGKKLSGYRKLSGLTQQQLGEKLNISPQAISKWENDLAQPDIASLKALSALYSVSLDELLDLDRELSIGRDAAKTVEEVAKNNADARDEIYGFCKNCGVAVKEGELGMKEPAVLCKSCARLLKEELLKKKEELERRELYKKYSLQFALEETLKQAFILGGCIGGIVFLLAIVLPLGNYSFLMMLAAYSIFSMCVLCDFDTLTVKIGFGVTTMGLELMVLAEDITDDGLGIIGVPLKIVSWAIRVFGYLCFLIIGGVIAPIEFPFKIKKIVNGVKSYDMSVLDEGKRFEIENRINSGK